MDGGNYEGIKKLYYSFDDYEYSTVSKKRVLSGIRNLDIDTKGFDFGAVTIWTGVTNSGKTTLLTMLTRETIKQGYKVFYFNGEQTKDDFKNNLYKQSVTSQDLFDVYYKDTAIKDTFVKENKVAELKKFYGDTLFVFDNNAPRDIDSLIFAMEDCRRNKNTEVFILDNFMQIDLITNDVYTEQSRIMEKLRTYAVQKEVVIHLVAHPRKMADYQTRLSLYDISGSMNLANKAYNVISIMRVDTMDEESLEYQNLKRKLCKERYDISQASSLIEVLKTKGNRCGLIPLKFDIQTKTYTELPTLTDKEWENLKAEVQSNQQKKKGGYE